MSTLIPTLSRKGRGGVSVELAATKEALLRRVGLGGNGNRCRFQSIGGGGQLDAAGGILATDNGQGQTVERLVVVGPLERFQVCRIAIIERGNGGRAVDFKGDLVVGV